ncbi:MAG: nuclear transport factor 2 family protein [Mycobacterium sp.]
MGTAMARTPEEIFDHHLHALITRDADELLVDYADDSVLITAAGVARGKDGIRAAFATVSDALVDAVFDVKSRTFDGDVLLLEWTLVSPGAHVDGTDTFVFGDDVIRAQTISQVVRRQG